MDKKKLVILILVVIGVLAFMALGAGFYRDKEEGGGKPPSNTDKYENKPAELIEGATGWMRTKFDLKRIKGCLPDQSGMIQIPGSCEVTIKPGSARPSQFKLYPSGGVLLCFGLTRKNLADCMGGKPGMKTLKAEGSAFTVAKDSAFLSLKCSLSSRCSVRVRS
jgi:hypothetical protein